MKEELRSNGYFTYRVTGDELMDLRLYGEAKEAFVAAYPDRYAQMVSESAPKGKIKLDHKDFDLLPDAKKLRIIESVDEYEILK